MEPVFVYVDTNGVEDFSGPRLPVDREMRRALLAAVKRGRIIIPFSEAVAQEIVAIWDRDKDKADEVARFYLEIASLDHALESTGIALRRVIGEHLGDAPGSPFTRLRPSQRKAVRLRLLGQTDDVAEIKAKYRSDSERWTTSTRGYRDRARALIAAERPIVPTKLAEVVPEVWSQLAPTWAWGLVDGRGWLPRAQERKLTDEQLLGIPGVRVAVGGAIGLAAAQTVNGRNPHRGDYGDVQHCTLAACAGLLLVTHDDDLRKLVEAIPDKPVEVIAAAELLARVA